MQSPALLIAAVFVLFAAPSAGFAQSAERSHDDVFLEQATVERLLEEDGLTEEDALEMIADRVGGDYAAIESHIGAAAPLGGSLSIVNQHGAGNLAGIVQRGSSHLAVLYQTGTGNQTDLLQAGTGHIFGVWLDGDANDLTVNQRGSGHTYLLDFAGSGLNHHVVQDGSMNQLVQIGPAAQPFSVQQRGVGINMTIRHNR